MKIRMLTKTALLCAAALILGYIDSLIPLVPSVPGIKLGLSNLVLLYAVFYMSPIHAVLIMLVKVGLSSLLFGNAVGALYSLAGGVHILGQLLIGSLLIGFRPMLVYAPWLLVSGLVTGILLGICARAAFYGLERYERRRGA